MVKASYISPRRIGSRGGARNCGFSQPKCTWTMACLFAHKAPTIKRIFALATMQIICRWSLDSAAIQGGLITARWKTKFYVGFILQRSDPGPTSQCAWRASSGSRLRASSRCAASFEPKSPAWICARHRPAHPLQSGQPRRPRHMDDRPLRGGWFKATDVGSGLGGYSPPMTKAAIKAAHS